MLKTEICDRVATESRPRRRMLLMTVVTVLVFVIPALTGYLLLRPTLVTAPIGYVLAPAEVAAHAYLVSRIGAGAVGFSQVRMMERRQLFGDLHIWIACTADSPAFNLLLHNLHADDETRPVFTGSVRYFRPFNGQSIYATNHIIMDDTGSGKLIEIETNRGVVPAWWPDDAGFNRMRVIVSPEGFRMFYSDTQGLVYWENRTYTN